MDLSFFFDGDDHSDLKPSYKGNSLDDIRKELAYHEASHFVIGLLFSKTCFGFKPVEKMMISSKEKTGGIRGLHSAVNFSEFKIFDNSLKKFYEIEERVHRRLFVAIAGYASFQVFINDVEEFIGDYQEGRYSTIETTNCNYIEGKPIENQTDFAKVNYFSTVVLKREYIPTAELLLRETQSIMKSKPIYDAIGFVKNQLIENDGLDLEGEKLKEITKKVGWLINKYSTKMILKRIARKLNEVPKFRSNKERRDAIEQGRK